VKGGGGLDELSQTRGARGGVLSEHSSEDWGYRCASRHAVLVHRGRGLNKIGEGESECTAHRAASESTSS